MPLSSRFTKLESHLRQKVHLKPRLPKYQVHDESKEISRARSAVYSIVLNAILAVIEAQDGTYTTASVTRYVTDQIVDELRAFTSVFDAVASSAASRYGPSSSHADLGRLKSTINSHVRLADNAATYVAFIVTRGFFGSPQTEATRAAVENGLQDITHAVCDTIMTHVDTAPPTAGDNPKLWPNVKNSAVKHPNSPRVIQIPEETGSEQQPLVKNASFISPHEAMAAGEMGCHGATISHTVLKELASRHHDTTRAFYPPPNGHRPPNPENKAELAKASRVSYLADDGKKLVEAIAADPETAKRLKITLDNFTGG
ncbi:transaldolase [Hypoxylon sp. FL1150]|nr:transaldolase [Hypoxylon sp. FL1150]